MTLNALIISNVDVVTYNIFVKSNLIRSLTIVEMSVSNQQGKSYTYIYIYIYIYLRTIFIKTRGALATPRMFL